MMILAYPHALNKQEYLSVSLVGYLYLASPLTTYDTPRYDQMVNLARHQFPSARLMPSCGLFVDSQDWLRRWSAVLTTLAGVAFFTDEAGWIGKGVYSELCDADAAGLPIWLLMDDDTIHAPDAFILAEPNEDDWRQYARVCIVSENEVR